MHPPKFLDRRDERRKLDWIGLAVRGGKRQAVVQWEERVPAGRLGLDRESDEIVRRPSVLPVHPDETHSVTAVKLEREEGLRVLAGHLEIAGRHTPSLSRPMTAATPCPFCQ